MAFSLSGSIYSFLGVLLFVNACAMAVDTLYTDSDAGTCVRRGTGARHGFLGAEYRIRPGRPRGGRSAGGSRWSSESAADQRRNSECSQYHYSARYAQHQANGMSDARPSAEPGGCGPRQSDGIGAAQQICPPAVSGGRSATVSMWAYSNRLRFGITMGHCPLPAIRRSAQRLRLRLQGAASFLGSF